MIHDAEKIHTMLHKSFNLFWKSTDNTSVCGLFHAHCDLNKDQKVINVIFKLFFY